MGKILDAAAVYQDKISISLQKIVERDKAKPAQCWDQISLIWASQLAECDMQGDKINSISLALAGNKMI